MHLKRLPILLTYSKVDRPRSVELRRKKARLLEPELIRSSPFDNVFE